jgi:hypothetical protein
MMVSTAAAVTINEFNVLQNGTDQRVYDAGEDVTLRLNASSSRNATLNLTSPERPEGVYEMDLVSNVTGNSTNSSNATAPYQIYEVKASLRSVPGRWEADYSAKKNNSSVEGSGEFLVATESPYFLSQDEDPSYLRKGENLTFHATLLDAGHDIEWVNVSFDDRDETLTMDQVSQDEELYRYEKEYTTKSGGNPEYFVTSMDSQDNGYRVSNRYTVYSEAEGTNVSVEVAPSCGTSLSYFLLPGDGQIVQNKTGVFVEIATNTGNIQSNITVDYLNVTFEDDEPWQRGMEKGPVIQSYEGERFENVRLSESVTYFKLFNARYELGNYTGRSSISTACGTEGYTNQVQQKENLNKSYTCGNLSANQFSCNNYSIVDTRLVAGETLLVNTTEEAENVSISRPGSGPIYKESGALGGTDYTFYTYNTSNNPSFYDYACATQNGSIESNECAYIGNQIRRHNIEVDEIAPDGTNASFTHLRDNNEYLNETLTCESIDNDTAECNSTQRYTEKFSFFGNFEIVKGIGGANRSGDQESDVSIPGDDPDEPGETEVPDPVPDPVPEPTPTPDPTPDPTPEISVEIQPLNDTYKTPQGLYQAAALNVTNMGSTSVPNITLRPLINRFRAEWDVRVANIGNLSVNETVQRDVFVRPAEDTSPGTYVIPVTAETERQLDMDYFQLEVTRAEEIPEIEIAEAPNSLSVNIGQNRTVPVLLENTGELNLTGINSEVQNLEECGTVSTGNISNIAVNGSKSLDLEFSPSSTTTSCNTTLVVSTAGGAYAFADLQVEVLPREGLIRPEARVPLLAIIWTAALAGYAFITRRYELESWMVKAPFLVLILGEVVIMLFILINAYELPLAAALPF